MAKKTTDWDSPENEVPSNWISWGVPVEDKIFGTLISRRTMKSTFPGKEGEDVNIYEMKADLGSFHALDEKKNPVDEATVIEPGSIWNIGGKESIDKQMRNIKLGQKIGLKFIEEVPAKTKGFAPAKLIKVFAPKNPDNTFVMDEEFLAEQAQGVEEEKYGE